jgi:hypothetical protein
MFHSLSRYQQVGREGAGSISFGESISGPASADCTQAERTTKLNNLIVVFDLERINFL